MGVIENWDFSQFGLFGGSRKWSEKMVRDEIRDAFELEKSTGNVPVDRADFSGGEDIAACFDSEDSFVGAVVWYKPDGHNMFWLDYIYVRPFMRQRGIAQYFVNVLKQRVDEGEVAKMECGVTKSNAASMTLFMKLMAPKSRPPQYFEYFANPVQARSEPIGEALAPAQARSVSRSDQQKIAASENKGRVA